MDIIVTGKHVEITESIKQYATDKAQKLPHYFDRISEIEVVADKRDSHTFLIEFIVHVDNHDHFVASAKHEDLYACIDLAADKAVRQLHDHKEKLRNPKHKTAPPA